MVLTGAELAALKGGLRKAASAVSKAALTGPGPGAGTVEKPLRTSRIPGQERRKRTIEAGDAERFARKIMERVRGQRFTLPGKPKPLRLEIPAAEVDSLVAGVGILMSALPGSRVDMALVLEVRGEPVALADRMRAAMPEAALAVGDTWVPVLDELTGIVCEHIIEFFTARETFGAAALLELLKPRARHHLPEDVIEMLNDYARLVREKSQRIRLFGLDLHEDDQAYDLMTGFVDLTIETADRSGSGWPDHQAERATWNRLDSLLTERGRILLEGPAGSGKSTLAQWLTLTCLDWPTTKMSVAVPFLIRLREFAGGQALNLPQPEDFIRALTPPLAGRLPDWESQLLRHGQAVVVVDGIDEIPEQFRDNALHWLDDLVVAYPAALVVVTTRPAGLADGWRQHLVGARNFTRAVINPMSAEQVSKFIDRWHEAATDRPHADPAELQECAASLKQSIRSRRDLSRITTTPLLCAMVCALYRADNRALPRNRTALYERACAMLLEKRDTQQKIQTFPVPLTREQIEPFLTEIALWMLLNKQRSIPRQDALAVVEEVVPRLQVPDPPKSWKLTAEELLRHLIVRSGVLQEPTMELVEFVHPSFQDFLAAKRIFQKAYLPHLIANAHDAMYQDVAVMAVSQVQNDHRQDELLEQLIERAKTDRKQSRQLYLLAAACVADVAMVDPKWVRLVRSKTRSLLPPQSSREALALAAAGEFTLDLLADAERTRKFSLTEAKATIEAIGLMRGGGEVGTRILRALAERFSAWVGSELISAWHQMQDPQAFRDEVLAHGDFTSTIVTINSGHLVQHLDGLPGVHELSLGRATPPSLDLTWLEISGVDARSLPDYPRLRTLELEEAPDTGLRGIERFPTLERVGIWSTPKPELDSLTALPRLAFVTVLEAKHVDLEPLAEIPTLAGLTLGSSDTIDLTPLADLWNLTYLSVGDASIVSRKALVHITGLSINDLHTGTASMFPGLRSVTTRAVTADKDAAVQFSRLTEVSLASEGVSDLRSLAAFPHLRSIELRTSAADEVIGLADLQIKELTLVDSPSLAVVGQAPMVQALKLRQVPGRLLAKLPTAPLLKQLDLWNISRPDLAGLGGKAQISSLGLRRVEDVDLRGLGALPSLTHLKMWGSHTVNVEPLRHLPHLENLEIYNTKYFDRSVLRELTSLRNLGLDCTFPIDPAWLPPHAELSLVNVSRLTPAELAALPTLRRITLGEMPGYGLAALAEVPHIESLLLASLAGVQTTDLAEWPALRSLELYNVSGLDFAALAILPHLRELTVDHMPCTGIDVLPGLEVLHLGRSKVELSEVSGLPKLRRLVLDAAPDTDLSLLTTLPRLTELELVNMPWADLTPFQARPDIKLIVR